MFTARKVCAYFGVDQRRELRLDVMDDDIAFAQLGRWTKISGLGRSRTYEEIAAGNLRAVKAGGRVLIDVEHGLNYLRSLPPFVAPPSALPRRRTAAA
jgi:hypothetical protein